MGGQVGLLDGYFDCCGWSHKWECVLVLTTPAMAHESVGCLETVLGRGCGPPGCEGFGPLALYGVWGKLALSCCSLTEWLQVSEYILPVAATYVCAGGREDESLIFNLQCHSVDDFNFSVSTLTTTTMSLSGKADDAVAGSMVWYSRV